MRHTRLLPFAAVATAVALTACSTSSPGGTASSTTPVQGTTSVPLSTSTSPAPAPTFAGVTKPPKDTFSLCDTRNVGKDRKGFFYCKDKQHEIPVGASSLTCIADFGKTDPKQASLHVTYSVFRQGRNVAYFRKIPQARYTVNDFQVRSDFTPQDAKFWGDKTLPPGSYYCEWYLPDETKLGDVDVIHGQLPSSTVGTPGQPF